MANSVNYQSFTLAAATAKLLVAVNPQRKLLLIENSGVNPMVFKNDAAPSSATDGMTLDPASAAGGQGGSILLTGGDTPVNAIWGYSTTGTTVTVGEGTTY